MAGTTTGTNANVIPTIRYSDAAAAIDWLCDAFDFERRLVVPGENGAIAHAQLVYRNGMIMLGSAGDREYDHLVRPVDEVGVATQSPYIVVEDADKHHARAVAAGAEIVIPLIDQDHGGRAYTCRDPQGQIWNFGTYDPWVDGE